MKSMKLFQRLAKGKREKAEIELIRPLIDAEFYLKNNPDVELAKVDPAQHYHLYGWKEGRDPSPSFSTRDYLTQNPDVQSAQTNPLLHHLHVVRDELASEPATEDESRQEMELLRPYFDSNFYIAQNPDVAAAKIDPLLHFVWQGWYEGRDPSPDFSTNGYLAAHSDVRQAGINPLRHYIEHGSAEGRGLDLFGTAEAALDAEFAMQSADTPSGDTGPLGSVDDIRPYFDTMYYLTQNDDVRESGIDPAEHYWINGWREGRDPSPDFSTRHYLETNPDLSAQPRIINPFWHYITAGRSEGRSPVHPGGYRVEQLRHTKPLEESVTSWMRLIAPDKMLAGDALDSLILARCPTTHGRLMIALGHDNYLRVSGGVQFCIHHEERIAGEQGNVYLNIHPWQPLPRLAHSDQDPDPLMVMILGGTEIGTAHMSEINAMVGRLRPAVAEIRVVVHHLLGHLPEQVADLVHATGSNDCWLWLHDYFTLCPGVTLRRNGVSYCGAPPVESNACTLCRFGPERVVHLQRIGRFFSDINVHVIAPSKVALELWQSRAPFKAASETLLPHMKLKRTARKDPPAPDAETAITIGFLGTPAAHKGWNVFERLMARLHDNPAYRFVYFGVSTPSMLHGTHVSVHVTADDRDAMINAVAAEHCDLVLHWATWPETFSLSTYEAYAGGAWVLTNTVSGNVAATVEANGRGAVLASRDDLFAFFEDGRAEAMVDKLRGERRDKKIAHKLSRMTHQIWDSRAAVGGK